MKPAIIKLICTISLILMAGVNKAQTFPWAKSGNGAGGWCEGMSIATDAASNVFISGQFGTSTVIFGTYTLTNAGTGNMYLAKYDTNGNILWAKSAGGANSDMAMAVCTDPAGNVLVAGGFSSSAFVAGTATLTNSNPGDDVFLIKYDTNGNVLWAKSVGGASSDDAYSVSTDGSGNIYLTGGFSSSLIAFGTTTLTNTGGSDAVFIAKYDPSGNALWAKGTGGTGDDGFSASTDAAGNSYVTGIFSSPSIAFGAYTLTNTGSGNIFITKYDTNGNALWAKSAGGTNFDEAYSVSIDAGGNAFVTGDFSSTSAVFGAYTLTNTMGSSAMFLAKYDTNGNALWVKKAGGSGEIGYCVSTYTGGVFVTGSIMSPTLAFGTYTLSPPAGSTDPMFIVKYDLNGNVLCAKALASGGDDVNAVSADKYGNAYITGDYYVSPFIVGSNTLTLLGIEDVFVANFNCQPDVTGIALVSESLVMKLFPNPNNGSFTLQCDSEIENGELILFNSTGGQVHVQKIAHGENAIATNELAGGLYNYAILQDKKRIGGGKLIVQ